MAHVEYYAFLFQSEGLGVIVYWLKVSADGRRGTAEVSGATTDTTAIVRER